MVRRADVLIGCPRNLVLLGLIVALIMNTTASSATVGIPLSLPYNFADLVSKCT